MARTSSIRNFPGGSAGYSYPTVMGASEADYGVMNPWYAPAATVGASQAGPALGTFGTWADASRGAQWTALQGARRAKPRMTTTGTGRPEDAYQTLDITRNPWLRGEVGKLETLAGAQAPVDYTQWINAVKSGGDVGKYYQRYQDVLGDTSGFTNAMLAANAELRARTDQLGTLLNQVQAERAKNLGAYDERVNALQAESKANIQGLIESSKQAQQLSLNEARRLMGKYGTGAQTGIGTAEIGKIQDMAQKIDQYYTQYRLNLLQGDVQQAKADATRLQALENQLSDYAARTGEVMYDQYGNVIGAEKATAAQFEQMRTTYAREGLDAAVAQWVRDFQTAQMVAELSNRPIQEILQRAQLAGVLGGMQDLYAYQGVQKRQPMQITQPTYPPMYEYPTGPGAEAAFGPPENFYGNLTSAITAAVAGGARGGGQAAAAQPAAFNPNDPFGVQAALSGARGQMFTRQVPTAGRPTNPWQSPPWSPEPFTT